MIDAVAETMMGRALKAARKARAHPRSAAIVAHGERVVSIAHNGDRAPDLAAIAEAGEEARGATLYSTIEPSSPAAIAEAGIARVVAGCADPKASTALAELVNRGVAIAIGVRELECRALIADYAHHVATGRAYAILKAAITLDGRIATRTGDSKWITGESARREGHRMRHRADAVMVGIGTVLADDPALTVRHVKGTNPLRVVLDTHLRIADGAQLARTEEARTLVVHGPSAPSDRQSALARLGVELWQAPLADARVDLEAVLRMLGARGVVRLLVEGGAKVHGAFLARGLAQRAAVFIAPRILGDPLAVPVADAGARERIADAFRIVTPSVRRLGDDLLVEGDLAAWT